MHVWQGSTLQWDPAHVPIVLPGRLTWTLTQAQFARRVTLDSTQRLHLSLAPIVLPGRLTWTLTQAQFARSVTLDSTQQLHLSLLAPIVLPESFCQSSGQPRRTSALIAVWVCIQQQEHGVASTV